MSLIELIRELQKIEKILKGKKDIHKVVKGSLGSFSQKRKNTIESTKQKENFKGKRKKKKSKEQSKCFLYGKKNTSGKGNAWLFFKEPVKYESFGFG